MHDYMKALWHRFNSPTEQIKLLEEETDRIYKKLVKQFGKQQKRLLLQLVDLENDLQDQACLNSFMCGYRLAHGIQQAKIYAPSITTMSMPISAMCMEAVNLLLNKINHPTSKTRQVLFETNLIIGRSTDENAPLYLEF